MPSPFPGVDPYIESQMWEDFHGNYITRLRDILTPGLVPKYGVIVERRVYLERSAVADGPSYLPDVGVFDANMGDGANAAPSQSATLPEPTICLLPAVEEHRESRLVIRNLQSREIVAVIELLSPTNKLRGADGRAVYLDKRSNLLQTNTHFIELDMLRTGERMPFSNPPPGDFFALIRRSCRARQAEVYGWSLRQPLPTIPIPLAGGDPDVRLDLQAAYTSAYDHARYDVILDYQQPLTPRLSPDDRAWADELVGRADM